MKYEVNATAGERLESVTGWRWGDSICQDQDQLLRCHPQKLPNITDADTDSGHHPASRRDAIQQKLYKWLTRNFFSPRVIDNQNNWLLFDIIYPGGHSITRTMGLWYTSFSICWTMLQLWRDLTPHWLIQLTVILCLLGFESGDKSR